MNLHIDANIQWLLKTNGIALTCLWTFIWLFPDYIPSLVLGLSSASLFCLQFAWIDFNFNLLFEGMYHTLTQGQSSNDNLGQNKMKWVSPSPPQSSDEGAQEQNMTSWHHWNGEKGGPDVSFILSKIVNLEVQWLSRKALSSKRVQWLFTDLFYGYFIFRLIEN